MMTTATRALVVFLLLPLTGCILAAAGTIERPVSRSFPARDGDVVQVKVPGGSIQVQTTTAPQVEVKLTARVRASSDEAATAVLEDYDVVLEKQGTDIIVSARRKSGRESSVWFGSRSSVSFRAEVAAPAGVVLRLDTSGGAITVRGDRTAPVSADTSGGAISVDGGPGDLALDTSGGSITIGRALGLVRAHTSGGSIRVAYVGPAAPSVDLDTSGGAIGVGIDPRASLRVNAETSGGHVSVNGLPLTPAPRDRNRLAGTLNDGRGTLRVHTSGGSIRLTAAEP
jgi:formylmethanofuran dehydrogenase subunit C